MTVGALLGFEVLSGHLEHVVALNADPVQGVLLRTRRLVLLVLIGRVMGFGHGQILSHAGKHGDGAGHACRGRKKMVIPPPDGSVH